MRVARAASRRRCGAVGLYLRVCQVSAVCFLAQPSGPHRVTQRCVRATHSVYPLNAAHVTVSGAGFDQNHGQNTPHMYRCREVSPRPRERAVIHTSAVWFGQGRAVWVSHPGQVGDRAGQYGRAGQGSCAAVCGQGSTAGQGRAGQGSWGHNCSRAEIRDLRW